jgi:hypothetical protein
MRLFFCQETCLYFYKKRRRHNISQKKLSVPAVIKKRKEIKSLQFLRDINQNNNNNNNNNDNNMIHV